MRARREARDGLSHLDRLRAFAHDDGPRLEAGRDGRSVLEEVARFEPVWVNAPLQHRRAAAHVIDAPGDYTGDRLVRSVRCGRDCEDGDRCDRRAWHCAPGEAWCSHCGSLLMALASAPLFWRTRVPF